MSDKPKLAIIGGGLSGLVAASKLEEHFDIQLFEKARGVGGRMSTRRADPYQFDHGAQFFTARSDAFKDFLKPYLASGLVQEWDAKIVSLPKDKRPYKREWFEPHYVAVPRMNSLCKNLAEKVSCHFSVEISEFKKESDQWILCDTQGKDQGPFDWVIVSAPSHQAASLLPSNFPDLGDIAAAKMIGCYSVMLGFDDMPKLNWDIAMPQDSLIGWIAVNHSKPDRETSPSILIQTTNDWAEAHIDEDVPEMEALIVQEFCTLTDIQKDQIKHCQTHRWRYAITNKPASQEFFLDQGLRIGVCGDWCIKGRVEAAFLSAYQLSEKILCSL